MRDTLTIKQQSFVDKYMELGNASEAYRQAYSTGNMNADSIKKRAYELMNHDKVSATIQALRGDLAEKASITKESLIDELKSITRGYKELFDLTMSMPTEFMTEDGEAVDNTLMAEKIKLLQGFVNGATTVAAIKQMSKMMGFDSAEKVEVEHKGIVINYVKPIED